MAAFATDVEQSLMESVRIRRFIEAWTDTPFPFLPFFVDFERRLHRARRISDWDILCRRVEAVQPVIISMCHSLSYGQGRGVAADRGTVYLSLIHI